MSLQSPLIELAWTLTPVSYEGPGRYTPKEEARKAEVPGAVQLDMARGQDYEDYAYAENWAEFRWMEEEYFLYTASFEDPRQHAAQTCRFCSAGIDYHFEVVLNGTLLLEQEGMFRPVELLLNELLQAQNRLEILIFPPPKGDFQEEDRRQASRSTKPAVSYGWDWHPRLIPSGIWDVSGLCLQEASALHECAVQAELSEDLQKGRIQAEIRGQGLSGCSLDLELIDPEGQLLLNEQLQAQGDELSWQAELMHPHLWWPHDHGPQARYELRVSLLNGEGQRMDQNSRKLGFRRVALLMNEGAWDIPAGFPKSRSPAPITLSINGRRIFCKGSNWVNPEIFPGRICKDQYAELLELAKDAHFNLLRVWGGGIVNKESFHDLCDELGLMVWQEFPLACNEYPDDPAYLALLESEARAILKRLRQHPSTVMWCGGNELFNRWSGMTDQSKALRLLNALCYELDPDLPFLMTSPLYGMGHGHYVLREDQHGEEVFSWMKRARGTAYTEYGVSGPADPELLRRIIPEEELWPPEPGGSWESHHAFHAWVGDTWLRKQMIEHYFGPAANLEDLVAQGQYLQGVGLRFIYEEARRQKPLCSMALNWCFNEPWPTAANSSILSYPASPKAAYAEVRAACRPLALSISVDKLIWVTQELLSLDLHLLHDSYERIDAGSVRIRLKQGANQQELLRWDHPTLAENENLCGPTCRIRIPDWEAGFLGIELLHEQRPEASSSYKLLLRKAGNQPGFFGLNE